MLRAFAAHEPAGAHRLGRLHVVGRVHHPVVDALHALGATLARAALLAVRSAVTIDRPRPRLALDEVPRDDLAVQRQQPLAVEPAKRARAAHKRLAVVRVAEREGDDAPREEVVGVERVEAA